MKKAMDATIIIGTDTGVGKTAVCAGLLKLIQGSRPVSYWKPIQTGTIVGDDTADIRSLTELGDEFFVDPSYRFAEPYSPFIAARKWGKRIDLCVLLKIVEDQRKKGVKMIVEGAGGLLVPYNENETQLDFIQKAELPVLLVTEDRVGAINQSLLSIQACRDAKVEVLGVVMTRVAGTFGNSECISSFGKVEVLAELPPSEDFRSTVAQVATNARLRQLFNVGVLPK